MERFIGHRFSAKKIKLSNFYRLYLVQFMDYTLYQNNINK